MLATVDLLLNMVGVATLSFFFFKMSGRAWSRFIRYHVQSSYELADARAECERLARELRYASRKRRR